MEALTKSTRRSSGISPLAVSAFPHAPDQNQRRERAAFESYFRTGIRERSTSPGGDLLESPQGLDVFVEAGDAVHWIEHRHVGTKPAPPICRGRQRCGSGASMRSQASMPNLASSRPIAAAMSLMCAWLTCNTRLLISSGEVVVNPGLKSDRDGRGLFSALQGE
jgi:hypothetical protein